MMRQLLVLLLALLFALPAAAEQPRPDEVQDLAAVVVSGAVPGPGLWQVRAEDGHVLWVFGTLRPLPRDIEWEPAEVEARLAESAVLLLPPGMSISAEVGFFKRLGLLPRLVGLKKDPEKQRLEEILPAELYARWLPLKARYLPRSRKVEKFRPLFAGFELYEAAARAAGLKDEDLAGRVLRKWAKRHHVPTASTSWSIAVEDPKAALLQFRGERLHDTACFEQILDAVEQRLPMMRELANAWSIGDVEVLAAYYREARDDACVDAISGADFARSRGFGDIGAEVRDAWLAAVDGALAEHASSFALLPMSNILTPGSYLDDLRARGYVVLPPGDEPADAVDAAAEPGPEPAP